MSALPPIATAKAGTP